MKLKNILIALMMIIGTTLMAQEKYEQAVVAQITIDNISTILSVSIEGQPFKKTKLSSGELEGHWDLSPLLKQVATMRQDGWEVWNTSSTVTLGLNATYFLRRKLK